MNCGININIVKHAQKDYRCYCCSIPIRKGELHISAFGYDDDNVQVNERIHAKPECYKEWVSNIEMIVADDLKQMIQKAQQTLVTRSQKQ